MIIDSFYSFTCQEHRIIDAIARQARDVYISFLYDPEDRTGTFDETEGSFLRVSRVVKTKDIILPVNHRASSSALAFAEEHIWKSTADTADDGEYFLTGEAVHLADDSQMTKLRNRHIGFILICSVIMR